MTTDFSRPPASGRSDASRLLRLYGSIYSRICGAHPDIRPWHFQWLAVKDLYRDLHRILPTLRGEVLDVGCGDKPYAAWLSAAENHVGLDIVSGPKVDYLAAADKPWQLEDSCFDALVCTQVLQYVGEPSLFIGEMRRVLKRGGTIILSVPFCYNEHDVVEDYWRYSAAGIAMLTGLEIAQIRKQGGFGSVVGILILNWLDSVFNLNTTTRLLKGVLLPLWIGVSAAINLSGWVLDRLDCTGRFYVNALIVGRKR